MKDKDIQNIIEAISFIEDQLQKNQKKLSSKVGELEKMLSAINLRVAELEESTYQKVSKNQN